MNHFYSIHKGIIAFTILFLLITPRLKAQYTVINKGVGGNSSGDLVSRVEKDVVALQPDVVIMMVGTNDMVNSHKFASYHEFTANYRRLIETLKSAGGEIILMSPPPVDTSYLFERHDRRLFLETPNVKLDSVNKIIGSLAHEYQVYFIDIYRAFERRNTPNADATSLLINEKNLGKRDGVHPTREGYELIAGEVYNLLKENKLLKRNMRIICFGDSITYGAFMEGAGTSEGDTYPAFLKRLIMQERIKRRSGSSEIPKYR